MPCPAPVRSTSMPTFASFCASPHPNSHDTDCRCLRCHFQRHLSPFASTSSSCYCSSLCSTSSLATGESTPPPASGMLYNLEMDSPPAVVLAGVDSVEGTPPPGPILRSLTPPDDVLVTHDCQECESMRQLSLKESNDENLTEDEKEMVKRDRARVKLLVSMGFKLSPLIEGCPSGSCDESPCSSDGEAEEKQQLVPIYVPPLFQVTRTGSPDLTSSSSDTSSSTSSFPTLRDIASTCRDLRTFQDMETVLQHTSRALPPAVRLSPACSPRPHTQRRHGSAIVDVRRVFQLQQSLEIQARVRNACLAERTSQRIRAYSSAPTFEILSQAKPMQAIAVE